MTIYSPEIITATAAAREFSAVLNGTEISQTVAYAGPIQHEKVRTVITEMLEAEGLEVTWENILRCTGIRSNECLKRLADGTEPKGSLVPMRPLGRKMVNPSGKVDGWATGRYLAGIVHVWVNELRTANQRA